jgi:DNA modification methylase
MKDMQFELDFTGFNPQELERLLNATASPRSTDPDAVPAPPDAATTQPRDMIVLDKLQLLCGDSSKPEDVDRLLDGAKVHVVNTDPPYNVRVEPRSNNAIAAGLSSFPSDERKQKKLLNKTYRTDGLQHHQGLGLARQPHKATPTSATLRAKDRPLANDFLGDADFERLLQAWFGNLARVLTPGRSFYLWGGYANCGNYPPVLKAHAL